MNEGQKNLPTKEIFSTARQTVALQTRLVLGGEALNPNKINLGKITPDQLSVIKPETIGKINQASTKERLDYWQGKGTFDEQLKTWCQEMVNYVHNPGFTEKEAMKVYNQYFGENKSESDINIYVDEVINGLSQNGKVNFDLLNQNLPNIKKMANIFGGNSSEIIESLILARAKLTDPAKKQELIEQVNEEKIVDGSPTLRLNQLNPDEERLLKWLNQDRTFTEETVIEENLTPVNLTNELAKTNPELYKKTLLEKIKKENPKMYSIWELLCKNNRTSADKLIIDSKTWYSESDSSDGIVVGTAPMEPGMKYRIIFDDSKFNYEDEVVYRFSHEMSHKIIHYLVETKSQNFEFNHLLVTLDRFRSQPDNRGISSLASLKTYKNKGVRIQAEEDMTEMVNMYIQNPSYLKDFFSFLSDPNYLKIREKYGLTNLSPKTSKLLFESVERGLKPLFDELENKVTSSPEPKPPASDPWESIPKPQQPIIIRAGKVERDAQGKRTSENAEVKLILGTAEHPLVTENKWSDGRIEKVRTTSPERPYHIPAVVYFDEDINDEQRRLINQAVDGTLSQIGVPKEFIIVSNRSASEFFSRLHPSAKRNNQYDASLLLHSFSQDRDQIEHPQHAIVFTNKDLYMSDTNFVVGAANDDLGTVISLHRFWNSVPDSELRDEVIKTEIAHEIGHVFGLPSNRRGEKNIENSLGPHCKNDGCCMKQGLTVPADWINYTRDRLKNNGDHYYCQDCQTDLREKFNKK